MERGERVWIAAWAVVLGLGLLILHHGVAGLDKPDAYVGVIWPLYAFIISLPLSLQMLSKHRRERLSWLLASGFSVAVAGAAAYVGQNAWVEGLTLTRHFGYSYSASPFVIGLIIAVCWFILMPFAEHKLVRRRWCDDYALLYAAAWCNIFKLVSAASFIALFWGLLFLWAGLFKVLKVNFFYDLFTDYHFAYPAGAIAFGMGLSLYSAKEDMLAGFYRACLNILGWLLPLATFILLLFLPALAIQGLEPLWSTHNATKLMLTLVGMMVFLFNAAWQDGGDASLGKFPKWLRGFISLGLVAMPLYLGLCAYSLGKRIGQYGWSIERIWGALLIAMLAIYALGYAVTALRRQAEWMQGAKAVNIVGSWAVVVLLLLTCSPVLNPVRIAVDSQISRLVAKELTVDTFDFDYLRFEAGKYGNQKLTELLNDNQLPQAQLIHEKVALTLKKSWRYDRGDRFNFNPKLDFSPKHIQEQLVMYPKGATPDRAFVDFLAKQLSLKKLSFSCFHEQTPCLILAIDLDADGQNEMVLFESSRNDSKVFSFADDGGWHSVGRLIGQSLGPLLEQSLEKQDVATPPHKWHDLRIGKDVFWIDER